MMKYVFEIPPGEGKTEHSGGGGFGGILQQVKCRRRLKRRGKQRTFGGTLGFFLNLFCVQCKEPKKICLILIFVAFFWKKNVGRPRKTPGKKIKIVLEIEVMECDGYQITT